MELQSRVGSGHAHTSSRLTRYNQLVVRLSTCFCLCRAASGGQRSDAVVCFVVQRADQAKRCYARVLESRCGVAGPLNGDLAMHNPRGIERLLRGFYEDCNEDPNKVVTGYLQSAPRYDGACGLQGRQARKARRCCWFACLAPAACLRIVPAT